MTTKSIFVLLGSLTAIIVSFLIIGNTLAWNSQGEYLYMQFPNGSQKVVTKPGPVFKWWASTDMYRQVVTVAVGHEKEAGSAHIEPFTVQFSDFAKAKMTGVVRIELPQSAEAIKEIRRQYAGGYQHFVANAIVPVVGNAFTLSANLRGAQEAAQTLALLQQDIMDQLQYGLFVTKSIVAIDTTWEIVGDTKTPKYEKRVKNEILRDSIGNPRRTRHVLMDLNCTVTSCQIDPPAFDDATEKTIQMRREASLATEVAKQNAIKATQDAITAEANGRATAMAAKWEQEKVKAEQVTIAEKNRDVARLDMEAAEFRKQANIKDGEGEATKRRLIMQADGALALKLDAYIKVMSIWAENVPKYQGSWVPAVVSGSGSNQSQGAFNMMDALGIKALKDLSLTIANKN